MSILDYVTLTSIFIILVIKIILIVIRKIKQHYIHKQCNYLCFVCKYRYECNDFLGKEY